MRSLNWKLGGALLLMVVVSIGLMAYLTNLSTTREFRQYISCINVVYAERVEQSLTLFYSKEYSWAGIQSALEASLEAEDGRLVVADSAGVVVGDSNGDWLGRDAEDIGLKGGILIDVLGKDVGEFYLIGIPGALVRRGNMGQWEKFIPPVLNMAEQDFLNRVQGSLILAGLLAAGVAILMGLIITRQIIRPLHALTAGARRISRGQLNYRVEVRSKDEIGDLAKSFNEMASVLSENEVTRRRLLADITHELRTPLTVIEGTVNGILDGVFESDKERLNSIKDETFMLTRLINDLRDISLAEAGQLKLEIASTDMVKLVNRKLLQAEGTARENGVHLELQAAQDIPEIGVDLFRMEQVIANLITNAVRHTFAGGKVAITLQEGTADDGSGLNCPHLLISVADTGEGIGAEHLAKIFERFYRADSSRAKSRGETGLGLAIVKQMVEAHSGRVWVESEQNKGSTFFVALPFDSYL